MTFFFWTKAPCVSRPICAYPTNDSYQSQTVPGKVLLHGLEEWVQSRWISRVRKRRKEQTAFYVDGVSCVSWLTSLFGWFHDSRPKPNRPRKSIVARRGRMDAEQSRWGSHARKRHKERNAVYVDRVSFASWLMSLSGWFHDSRPTDEKYRCTPGKNGCRADGYLTYAKQLNE